MSKLLVNLLCAALPGGDFASIVLERLNVIRDSKASAYEKLTEIEEVLSERLQYTSTDTAAKVPVLAAIQKTVEEFHEQVKQKLQALDEENKGRKRDRFRAKLKSVFVDDQEDPSIMIQEFSLKLQHYEQVVSETTLDTVLKTAEVAQETKATLSDIEARLKFSVVFDESQGVRVEDLDEMVAQMRSGVESKRREAEARLLNTVKNPLLPADALTIAMSLLGTGTSDGAKLHGFIILSKLMEPSKQFARTDVAVPRGDEGSVEPEEAREVFSTNGEVTGLDSNEESQVSPEPAAKQSDSNDEESDIRPKVIWESLKRLLEFTQDEATEFKQLALELLDKFESYSKLVFFNIVWEKMNSNAAFTQDMAKSDLVHRIVGAAGKWTYAFGPFLALTGYDACLPEFIAANGIATFAKIYEHAGKNDVRKEAKLHCWIPDLLVDEVIDSLVRVAQSDIGRQHFATNVEHLWPLRDYMQRIDEASGVHGWMEDSNLEVSEGSFVPDDMCLQRVESAAKVLWSFSFNDECKVRMARSLDFRPSLGENVTGKLEVGLVEWTEWNDRAHVVLNDEFKKMQGGFWEPINGNQKWLFEILTEWLPRINCNLTLNHEVGLVAARRWHTSQGVNHDRKPDTSLISSFVKLELAYWIKSVLSFVGKPEEERSCDTYSLCLEVLVDLIANGDDVAAERAGCVLWYCTALLPWFSDDPRVDRNFELALQVFPYLEEEVTELHGNFEWNDNITRTFWLTAIFANLTWHHPNKGAFEDIAIAGALRLVESEDCRKFSFLVEYILSRCDFVECERSVADVIPFLTACVRKRKELGFKLGTLKFAVPLATNTCLPYWRSVYALCCLWGNRKEEILRSGGIQVAERMLEYVKLLPAYQSEFQDEYLANIRTDITAELERRVSESQTEP